MEPKKIFEPQNRLWLPPTELEVLGTGGFDWTLHRVRLEHGPLFISVSGTQTPRVQLGRVGYSNGVLVRGDFPADSVLLVHQRRKVHAVYHNREVAGAEVVFSREGDEVDFIMREGDDVYTIAVEADFFKEMFVELFGETALKQASRSRRLRLKQTCQNRFAAKVESWIFQLHEGRLQKEGVPYDAIEKVMLRELLECIDTVKVFRERKRFGIEQVREALEENLENTVTIPEIAQRLGIGKRQLYGAFKERYGMSPKKYLRMLRLDAIRKELAVADGSVKVSDVALKYGFLHLGHFAAEYKKVFGKSPSETLNREVLKKNGV